VRSIIYLIIINGAFIITRVLIQREDASIICWRLEIADEMDFQPMERGGKVVFRAIDNRGIE